MLIYWHHIVNIAYASASFAGRLPTSRPSFISTSIAMDELDELWRHMRIAGTRLTKLQSCCHSTGGTTTGPQDSTLFA